MSIFSKLKISQKLPIVMLTLALLNTGIVTGIALYDLRHEQINNYTEKLEALRDDHMASLQDYLRTINEDLIIQSNSEFMRQIVKDFTQSWNVLPDENKTATLQKLYIDENPNEAGKKQLFDKAPDGSAYSETHAKYNPWLRKWLDQKGYYDIFLFDAQGDIIFTVFKERDFATNTITGQWKDTDIAALFRDLKAKPEQDRIVFYDFKPYAPSNNVPAAFVGTPILDTDGTFIGALAFQMPIARINELTQVNDDISKTAELHIVGADRLLRNDPDTSDSEDPILKDTINSAAVDKALVGERGVMEDIDGTDKTYAAYDSFDFHGTKFVILVDIFHSEVMAGVQKIINDMAIGSFIVLFVIIFVGVLYSRRLSRPITEMVDVMGQLANRDYGVAVPSQDRGDEIGMMAKAVQVFKDNGMAVARLQEEQEQLKHQAEIDKKAAMNKLADDFDSRTSGIISALAAAATEMQATAAQMTSASDGTSHASAVVASAAAEADSNVQTVAAAAEELSASSSEIARQISSVAQKSSRASEEAETANREVSELNVLADSIGEVVGAIKDIAEQTNLLALNATIEAARAGDAGKGFAVVADEVKKLANETSAKTEEIGGRVARIQQAVRSSVDAVQRIINNIRDIDGATSTVASAVEEQNAATSEIGRNVSEASTGTQQVAQSILDVQRNATETSNASATVQSAATELAQISDDLQKQVQKFLSEIRQG